MSTDPVPELHSLVDGLPPAELRRILHLVLGELEAAGSRRNATAAAGDDQTSPRRLSFAGMIEDDTDAAERSEELLREEFRRRA